MVPLALQAAIARHGEHQVDAAAGGQGGGYQRAAGADVARLTIRVGLEAARQVFANAAGRIGVRRPPSVMSGVVVGRLDTEQVAGAGMGGHATSSVDWPYLKAS